MLIYSHVFLKNLKIPEIFFNQTGKYFTSPTFVETPDIDSDICTVYK